MDRIDTPFNENERKLMDVVERGDYETVPDFDRMKAAAEEAARNTLKKTERINLRLTKQDYIGIKAAAMEEGIPYQTLIGHVVREYLQRRIRDRVGQ